MDFAQYLPKELSEKVFSYLSATDLSRASMCNILWRTRTNQDHLWLHHCAQHGWLRFGLSENLIKLKQSAKTISNSTTSPYFNDIALQGDTSLAQVCKWKQVYVRAHHLQKNWRLGKYTVAPALRGHKVYISAMAVKGRILVTGDSDGILNVWDLYDLKLQYKLTRCHTDVINCIQFFDNLIITACGDGKIRLIEAESGHLAHVFHGHVASVDKIQVDQDLLVSSGDDRSLRVWSLKEKILLHTMTGHTDSIECLGVHKGLCVSGSWDNSMMLWDLCNGRRLNVLQGHTEVINCCQFDERRVISGSADGTLKIWATLTGRCRKTLVGHHNEVYCLAYNEEIIASGFSDSCIIIWTHEGEVLHTLRGHLGIVLSLSLDRDKLVSAGQQKKIIVWDYRKGELLNTVHRQPTHVQLMCVQNTRLITVSPDKPGVVTVINYW